MSVNHANVSAFVGASLLAMDVNDNAPSLK
jgi:hypothetical protein